MVEIFKTNVQQEDKARQLLKTLVEHFPSIKVNFDLDDCDRILRAEGINIPFAGIIDILQASGYSCQILE